MSFDRTVLFQLATNTAFERAVRAVPFGERQARRAASRYVAGASEAEAFDLATRLHERGIASSVDHFGELVDDPAEAAAVAGDYLDLAGRIGSLPEDTWLSVDLSHLGLRNGVATCAEQLAVIADRLPEGRRIQVGAEDSAHTDAVLDCVLTVAGQGSAGQRLADRLGATVQANLRRSPDDLERLIDAGVHVRLVKGAYVERDAVPYGEPTDVAYLRLAHRLAEAGAEFSLATHDGVLREALLAALGPRPVEQLLGVCPDVLDDLVARGVPVRVYLPYGADWFRYWMRRLAESRGA